jgi:hypothetical protein
MKRILLLILIIPLSVFSQASKVDSLAVRVLDRMSDVIGELNSCSYGLKVSVDKPGPYGLEKHFSENEVYLKGPDKMLVQSKGENFHKGYWYNGTHMVYYSYNEHNYSVVDAPDNIMKTIDSINTHYGVEFPAADFFYPAFTDDILAEFPTVVFLGNKKIDGKECFHILADNEKLGVQMWISNDALTLPVKLVINYKSTVNGAARQYEATFFNWEINPDIPNVIFEFNAPPEARQIAIMSKKK